MLRFPIKLRRERGPEDLRAVEDAAASYEGCNMFYEAGGYYRVNTEGVLIALFFILR
jgi:hypothetical protein